MSTRSIAIIVAVIVLAMLIPRFVKIVPPGHVGVAYLFGDIRKNSYPSGAHFPVNPFLSWDDFDVRENSHKETAQVPTRDQLQTKVDVSVQWRIDPVMAPEVFKEVGTKDEVIKVWLVPKIRELVRQQGTTISKAEDFFQEETRKRLQDALLSGLQEYLSPRGVEVKAVLIRDINLPPVLTQAIEKKKEREQAVEREKAELERFRTEQMQTVAQAEARKTAAEQEALQIRLLAEAKADEIRLINDAVSKNPAFIQLQALKTLAEMSKDPAAKIYFIDSNSPQPLPLLHMGDSVGK